MPFGGGPELIARAFVAATAIELEVPVMDEVTVSVAVTDCGPAVSMIIVKFPDPNDSGPLVGRIALLSELVILTDPA